MKSYQIFKYTLALVFSLITVLSVSAQSHFTIHGKLSKNQQGTVMLYRQNEGKTLKDSAIVKDGQFTLKGDIGDPAYANIILNPYRGKLTMAIRQSQLSRSLFLYVEASDIVITSADSLKNGKITGSKAQVDFETIKAQRKPYTSKLDSIKPLGKPYHDAGNDSALLRLQKMAVFLTRKKQVVDSTFIQKHPDSYIAFVVWQGSMGAYVDQNTESRFKHFSAWIQNSVEGKKMADRIALAKKLDVGMAAPDFTLTDTLGHPVSLSSLKGKNVLVYFWQSNFLNFQEFIFDMGRINRKLQGDNFVMLGVYFGNVNKGSDAIDYWKKRIAEGQMNWLNVADMHGIDQHGNAVSTTARAYGLMTNAMPDAYLIGPDGRIIVRHVNFIDPGAAAKLLKLINK